MDSIAGCRELCIQATNYVCRSATYYTNFRTCKLSEESRRSAPASFRPAARGTFYLENECAVCKCWKVLTMSSILCVSASQLRVHRHARQLPPLHRHLPGQRGRHRGLQGRVQQAGQVQLQVLQLQLGQEGVLPLVRSVARL